MCIAKNKVTKKGEEPGIQEKVSDVALWKMKEILRTAGEESPSGTASLECSQCKLMEENGHTQESEFFEKNETYRIPDEFEFERVFLILLKNCG